MSFGLYVLCVLLMGAKAQPCLGVTVMHKEVAKMKC